MSSDGDALKGAESQYESDPADWLPTCTCPGACELGMGLFGTCVAIVIGFFALTLPFWLFAIVEWVR